MNDIILAIQEVSVEILTTLGLLALLLTLGILVGRWAHLKKTLSPGFLPKPRFRWQSGQWRKVSIKQEPSPATWWVSFGQSISAELFGAVITTFCFGIILLIFQQYQDIQARKIALILQMGSSDNTSAIQAVRELRAMGWLDDGILRGALLATANLENADLSGANLADADLRGANLNGVNLRTANLQRASLENAFLKDVDFFQTHLEYADLEGATLQESSLFETYLQGTDMRSVDLQGATLSGISFQHVNLSQANLKNAVVRNLIFDELTIPPDANWMPFNDCRRIFYGSCWGYLEELGFTLDGDILQFNGEYISQYEIYWDGEGSDVGFILYDKYWTPETDLTRYTDPDHKDKNGNLDFWEPDWVKRQRENQQ